VQLSNLHGGDQVLNEAFPIRGSKVPARFSDELQIMDVKSYADSIFGKSSHEEYRRKQLESARLRLFGRRLHNPLPDFRLLWCISSTRCTPD
jgi:hypothetical protein